PTLTPEIALAFDGPLYAQPPGDLTRWMAVPWPTDTASCKASCQSTVRLAAYDPYLHTFCPARLPNHVLAEEDDEVVVHTSRQIAERLPVFHQRRTWPRCRPNPYVAAISEMVR
ncbi:hypothetical protein VM98_36130, partial [Streptomyces rubellomurinus subsp. indigoferus]